uniref:G-protein coupled receptors family 1 profile domain-containing protein n=1 Tax=Plectus sambesii TaxID=2011161 RepID=A0A914WQR1_9BILA
MQSDLILAYVMLMTAVFGCVGNLLSLFIFTRPSMTSSVNVLLAGLSAIDLVLLVLVVPVFVLPSLPIWTEDTLQVFTAFMLKLVYPVNLTTQTCSIYVMVFITVERWTAVCHPLKVRVWCTVGKSRAALLIILLLAIAYNVIRFWEYSIVYANGTIGYERNLRNFDAHPAYMRGYFTASYLITHFLVPFGLLLGLNSHVSMTIIRMKRARRQLTRQERGEQRTTMMLMIVTVVFAACNTLPFLMNFIESAKPDFFIDENTMTLAYHLNDMSNLLVVINSATTSVIYFLFSQKYRDILLFTLTCEASRSFAAICGCSDFAAGKYLTSSANLSRTNTSHRASRMSCRSRSSAYAGPASPLPRNGRSASTVSHNPRPLPADHIKRQCEKSSDTYDSPNLLYVSPNNGHVVDTKIATPYLDDEDDNTSPLLPSGQSPVTDETSFVSTNIISDQTDL